MNTENDEKVDQVLMKNHPLENQELINKLSKSVCKIETYKDFASGFLIILQKGENDYFFLVTNEHVINKEMIKSNKKIKFYYDTINDKNKFVEIELNEKERFIRTYKYMNIDACLVEIISSDNIDPSYFLPKPNLDKINMYEKLKNKSIRILQFPGGGPLQFSKDEIIDINLPSYELFYKASTEFGSSGSPIFLDNSEEVIGIHKQGGKSKNNGNFLGPIILSLKNNRQYVETSFTNSSESYEGEINKNNMKEGFGKYIDKNENYYIGQWLNDKKYGIGIEYEKNKSGKKDRIIYEGEFVNNEYEGEGTFYPENDGKYIGKWSNNKRNGKGIKYYNDLINMKEYEGDFLNDEYHGEGTYYYKDGKKEYKGGWRNNKRNGKGIKYYDNENNTEEYDGEFINDEYHGEGTYYYKDRKTEYEGGWRNNKRNGKGIKYYDNENNTKEYDGEFINDEYHGEGTHFYKNRKTEYEGGWRNNKRNGKGTKYYDNENNTKEYDGDFENNEFQGEGKYFYESGKVQYDGNWRNNRRNGQGTKFYDTLGNPPEYEGSFLNDEYHGQGTLFSILNRKMEYFGEWKNNKRDGSGTSYFNNGDVKDDGIFKNDQLFNGSGSKYENGNVTKYTLENGELKKNNNSYCFN